MTEQIKLNLGAGIDEALQGLYDKMLQVAEHGYHPFHSSFNSKLDGGFVRDTFENFSARNSMFLRIYTRYLEKVEGLDGKVAPVFLTLAQAKKLGGEYANQYGVPVEPSEQRGCPVFSPLSFPVEKEKLSVIQLFRLKVRGYKNITPTMLADARAKGEPENIVNLSYNSESDKVFQIIPGKFRQYLVYNACEFSGLPDNITFVPPDEIIPFNDAHQRYLDLVSDNNVGTKLLKGPGPKGSYNLVDNVIKIRDPNTFIFDKDGAQSKAGEAEYLSNNFHELMHSTGYLTKDNRFTKGFGFDKKAGGIEEVVAETGAVMLSSAFGIEEHPMNKSANYIMDYLNEAESPTSTLWAISTQCSGIISALNNNDPYLSALLNKSPVFAQAMIWNARATTKNPDSAFDKLENMVGLGNNKQAGLYALSTVAKNLAKHGDNTLSQYKYALGVGGNLSLEAGIKSSMVKAVGFLEKEIPSIKADIKAEFTDKVQVIPAVTSSGPTPS